MAEALKVDSIEAIIDAIIVANRTHQPDTELYQLRNPIGLKRRDKETGQLSYREFNTLGGGYKAAIFDIRLKILGLSVHRFKEYDSIESLMTFYSVSDHKTFLSFIRRALKDTTISLKTPLKYFTDRIINGKA